MQRKEGSKTFESHFSLFVSLTIPETKKPLRIEEILLFFFFFNPWDLCCTTRQQSRTDDGTYLVSSQKAEFTTVATIFSFLNNENNRHVFSRSVSCVPALNSVLYNEHCLETLKI